MDEEVSHVVFCRWERTMGVMKWKNMQHMTLPWRRMSETKQFFF